MSTPSVADRIFGSGPLGRPALARPLARGLGRIEVHGPARLPDRVRADLAELGAETSLSHEERMAA
jgi:hypothetical protein